MGCFYVQVACKVFRVWCDSSNRVQLENLATCSTSLTDKSIWCGQTIKQNISSKIKTLAFKVLQALSMKSWRIIFLKKDRKHLNSSSLVSWTVMYFFPFFFFLVLFGHILMRGPFTDLDILSVTRIWWDYNTFITLKLWFMGEQLQFVLQFSL